MTTFLLSALLALSPLSPSTPYDPTRLEIETRASFQVSGPYVLDLGIFGCDSPQVHQFADNLSAEGWSPDGAAQDFGEALMDPLGKVIVTFTC